MNVLLSLEKRQDVPFEALITECAKDHEADIKDVIVLFVEEGHGIHHHDKGCNKDNPVRQCYMACDDADWIVHLQYNDRGHQAIYGVLDGTFDLWMD